MKLLAIDYGSKHIGIAISSKKGTIAFPHSVIENNSRLFKILLTLIQEEGIDKVIVGAPEYNKNTAFYQSVEKFIPKLAQTLTIPVESFDELLTSETARKSEAARRVSKHAGVPPPRRQQKNRHDLAAVLILESYITRTHSSL